MMYELVMAPVTGKSLKDTPVNVELAYSVVPPVYSDKSQGASFV